MGAPFANVNGNASGAAYVVFGKASFGPSIKLSDLTGTDGFRVASTVNSECGTGVACAGDVNGDGFSDVIVGAIGAGSNGESYVIFGKASPFNPSITPAELTGANGFRVSGPGEPGLFGWSVAGAGDINGDGYGDLIIGAPWSGANGPGSGASYVVFGKETWSTPSFNPSSLTGPDGFRLVGAGPGRLSGCSVSGAGDLNGDGFADLIVAEEKGGSSHVVFGKAAGFTSPMSLADLTGANGFQLIGPETGVRSQLSVSGAGDFNADGFADLIVGALGFRSNGEDSGAGFMVFGKAAWSTPSINLSNLTGTDGFRLAGGVEFDYAGNSVAGAGDVNGDGFADVIVGAMRATQNNEGACGSSYVIFGGNSPDATFRSRTGPGNSPKTAIGGMVNGIPSSRMWLDFDGGTTSSIERVTLTRDARENLHNLEPTEDGARTVWDVHSNRIGWTSCTVTLQYTDADIAGISGGESGLTIFRAPAPTGPWTPLTSSTVNAAKNQISASTNKLAFFSIAASSVPVTLTEWELE